MKTFKKLMLAIPFLCVFGVAGCGDSKFNKISPLGISNQMTNGEILELVRNFQPKFKINQIQHQQTNEVRSHIFELSVNSDIQFFEPAKQEWVFKFKPFVVTDLDEKNLLSISGKQLSFSELSETASYPSRQYIYDLYKSYYERIQQDFELKDERVGDVTLGPQDPNTKKLISFSMNKNDGYVLANSLFRADKVCLLLSLNGEQQYKGSHSYNHYISIEYQFDCSLNAL